MEEEGGIQAQEAHRTPTGMIRNDRHSTLESNVQQPIRKKESAACTEKSQATRAGSPLRITADFSSETLQARREWKDIVQVLKQTATPQNYIQ